MKFFILGLGLFIFATATCAQTDQAGRQSSKLKPNSKITPTKKKSLKAKTASTRQPATDRSTVKIISSRLLYATFQLKINQPECEVFLTGGNVVGNNGYYTKPDGSPWIAYGLIAGTYSLTIRKTGFQEVRERIEIQGGVTNNFSFAMRPL